jgi:hypothetical protein
MSDDAGDPPDDAPDGEDVAPRDRPEPPDADGEPEADLPPEEVDRVFALMDEAVTGDAVEGSRVRRLLSVLERALSSPAETSPETLAELVSILEAALVDPDDFGDIDWVLGVLEEAVGGATAADSENLQDVFAVLEEGFRDPAALDPEDVERFRWGLGGAIVDLTDPAGGDFGGLFPVPGLTGVDPEEVEQASDGDAVDLYSIARVATR